MTEKKRLKIPVAKIGRFYMEAPESPLGYKVVEFTQDDFDYMLTNPRARGYETPLRRGHNKKGQGIRDGETADAHLESFFQEDDVLFGEFEPHNEQVLTEIENEEFRYASGEFIRNALDKTDPDSRIPIFVKAVGLTNTPFIPDLPKATLINCSEGSGGFFRLSLVEAEDLSDAVVPRTQEETSVQSNVQPEPKPAAPTEESLADMSLDDLRAEIEKAFRKSFCTITNHEYCYCGPYVRGIYHEAGYLVASKDDMTYRYDFTQGEGGYAFSEPQRVVMQFEVVENLSDDLIPGAQDPVNRVERSFTQKLNAMFEKISALVTGQSLVAGNTAGLEPVPVSLSEGEQAPEIAEAAPPADAAPAPADELPAEPQPEENPAAEGEGQPEGDAPAPQPEAVAPEHDSPTEESDMTPEEIAALKAELDAYKAKEAELEAERQALAEKAFEQSLSDFVEEAAKFITPAAAEKLAGVLRVTRDVEAFSLSEGEAPVSISDAILSAVREAVPTAATQEVLGEQAGAVSLSDSAEPQNPWAAHIAQLKAGK